VAKKKTSSAKPPIDVEADAKPEARPADLKAIVELARKMYKLEVEMAAIEKQLKDKSEEFNKLQLETLPERMRVAGLQEFMLDNGYKVEVKDFIRGSIPTESAIAEADPVERVALQKRRDEAIKWLVKHNAGALIKNKLTAEFGKGEDKAAKKFEEQIAKKGYQVKREESVNFQTLNSFLREALESGVEVPVEPFALFNGKKATLKQIVKK
jgi:hypothetical protein